jgi:hypothetical protein
MTEQQKSPQEQTKSEKSNWSWKLCSDLKNCPFSPLANPYKLNNSFGEDHLSLYSWKLTVWKRNYVFPIDLKLRVPVVALFTLFPLLSYLIRN